MPQPGTHSASVGGLSGLPPPSGDARGSRKVVTLQLPFRKELLAAALDSDDEDEPAAKRVKATGAKSRLMDFLPPPKNDLGSVGSALGAGAVAKPGPQAPKGTSRASGGSAGGAEAALPSDFFGGDVHLMPYSNEAYRVADDNTHVEAAAGDLGPPGFAGAPGPSAYSHDYYAHAAGHGSASYVPDYGPGPGPGLVHGYPGTAGPGRGPGAMGPVGPSEAEDLIEAALRVEQERASKRGGGGTGGVKLVEINAKDLTKMDPATREAANSARDALGPEYALTLRRSAQPFEGSKMARRKHQIGTLLFNARMQELEQMEKRTQGQKSKAETAAKYGW